MIEVANQIRRGDVQNLPEWVKPEYQPKDGNGRRIPKITEKPESTTATVASAAQTPTTQASAKQPLTLAAVIELSPHELSQLKPMELLKAHHTVKQWKASEPKLDHSQGSEQLAKDLGVEVMARAKLYPQLDQHRARVEQGPRSLLNPLGLGQEAYFRACGDYYLTKDRIEFASQQCIELEQQLHQARRQEAAYQNWSQDPQSRQIAQLEQQLAHPQVQAKL